jgi:hypothetical protein
LIGSAGVALLDGLENAREFAHNRLLLSRSAAGEPAKKPLPITFNTAE